MIASTNGAAIAAPQHATKAGPIERLAVLLPERSIELEIQWIAPERISAPLIVFLHEGLGAIASWDDWPRRLCAATGCRGLVYCRFGYGGSSSRPSGQDWPIDYLEQEAHIVLPAMFDALGIDVSSNPPILFGHSDGGSIALLHAAAFANRVTAIITVAPHVFVEKIGLERIAKLDLAYREGPLRDKLQALHQEPDAVFWGWSRRWQDPAFRNWNISACLPDISCPVLAVQGAQDQYGTMEQVHTVIRGATLAELAVIDNCRHSPHQDQPQALLDCASRFIQANCTPARSGD